MDSKQQLEMLWWIITIIVVFAVLYPIYNTLGGEYLYTWTNVIFIVTFITVTRYIFLLQHTWLADKETVKVILVFLAVPAVFLLSQELNLFQTYINKQGLDSIVGKLPYDKRANMINFIRSEMFFFGVGSIISTALLPFRLILSVWRKRNRGTV